MFFRNDGILKSTDFLGDLNEYRYTNGRLDAIKSDQYGEVKYLYDEQDRVKEVRLQDGQVIEYRYETGTGKGPGRKSTARPKPTLTVVRHPAVEHTGGPGRR